MPSTVGHLVSVNVGLPRDVEWRGRTVRTGVWKSPVEGPVMVRTLNLDGDGQGDLGGHGGPHRAVLVYQTDSYQHWKRELGRTDIDHGQFGENLTVAGMPDDEVCIGDRYEIGDALFEVSQPRVTCYRVGLRMGEPRLPSLLVSHRRPGFYLRVLREGSVQAGDPIVRVGVGPERMSVAEVDALLYLPGHDRDDVARALRIPALSPGWRGSFEALLNARPGTGGNAGLNGPAPTPPAWAGFRPLRVLDIVSESATVTSLRLGAPDGEALPTALPGQFITLQLQPGDQSALTSRNYSLSGAPGGPEYRVSVKREAHGLVSRYIHERVRAGAVVQVAAPRGRFTLDASDAPVLLLSAGIGVTPVLAMLHSLASAGSGRQVWWLHGARNSDEHPFAAEVRVLLEQLPSATAHICYTAPLPGDRLGREYTHHGRLSADLLERLAIPADAHAFVCGPQLFMIQVQAALTQLGVDPDRVHTEVFGAASALTPGIAPGTVMPPHAPDGVPGAGPQVTFARSGLTVCWREGFASLLELAEACDVPVRWSCRTGVCHNCETGALVGTVSYDPAPVDLPPAGNVLICCAAPEDDLVLDL